MGNITYLFPYWPLKGQQLPVTLAWGELQIVHASTASALFIFNFFSKIFIYLFWAVLGLHCCAQVFSSCGKWGLLSSCIARVASHCGGFSWYGAQALGHTGFFLIVVHGLSSWGALAQLPCGVWGLPWPGIKLVSPALQDGFLTTGQPGKPCFSFLISIFIYLATLGLSCST